MTRADFAYRNLEPLTDRDLRFLLEHFPEPGRSYEEMARIIHRLPTTVESMLDSEYVFRRILDRRPLLLEISPFLLFNVLLRRTLGHRTAKDRHVINYIANLLSLFVKTERVYRVQGDDEKIYEYMIDLTAEAQHADPRRQFLIYSHVGNYSLFLTGMFPQWLEYRHRYKRRPVDSGYYVALGRAYFERASGHPLAREYGLSDVFLRLAIMFDYYKDGLNRMSRQYLCAA